MYLYGSRYIWGNCLQTHLKQGFWALNVPFASLLGSKSSQELPQIFHVLAAAHVFKTLTCVINHFVAEKNVNNSEKKGCTVIRSHGLKSWLVWQMLPKVWLQTQQYAYKRRHIDPIFNSQGVLFCETANTTNFRQEQLLQASIRHVLGREFSDADDSTKRNLVGTVAFAATESCFNWLVFFKNWLNSMQIQIRTYWDPKMGWTTIELEIWIRMSQATTFRGFSLAKNMYCFKTFILGHCQLRLSTKHWSWFRFGFWFKFSIRFRFEFYIGFLNVCLASDWL